MPDRSQATLEAWLRTHREVEIISRDRAGEYAAAARKGAPQAQQVADRFHLLVNLRDGLKKLMERKQACLPEIEEDTPAVIPHKARRRVKEVSALQASQQARPEGHFRTMSPKLRSRGTAPSRDAQTPAQVSRVNRYRRYQAVRTLHQQGFSQREIARRFKLGRATVRRFLCTLPLCHNSLPVPGN